MFTYMFWIVFCTVRFGSGEWTSRNYKFDTPLIISSNTGMSLISLVISVSYFINNLDVSSNALRKLTDTNKVIKGLMDDIDEFNNIPMPINVATDQFQFTFRSSPTISYQKQQKKESKLINIL